MRALVFVLLGACAGTLPGGTPPPKEPELLGDSVAPPAMEVLPSADVQLAFLTREMRTARRLSAESLNVPAPPWPVGKTSSEIEAWAGRDLKNWLELKHQRVTAAREELDRAAVQDHRQRIMAGALVGLVYEDIARVLVELPVPSELDREPEIALVYHEVLLRQALPYVAQSRAAYRACSGNAVQLPTMRHWSDFCDARAARLPKVPGLGPAHEKRVSVR